MIRLTNPKNLIGSPDGLAHLRDRAHSSQHVRSNRWLLRRCRPKWPVIHAIRRHAPAQASRMARPYSHWNSSPTSHETIAMHSAGLPTAMFQS